MMNCPVFGRNIRIIDENGTNLIVKYYELPGRVCEQLWSDDKLSEADLQFFSGLEVLCRWSGRMR